MVKRNIKKNLILRDLTTFHLGGPAEFYFEVKNKKDIIYAHDFAKKKKINLFVLGGGSDILVSDKGIKGMVIKITDKSLKIKGNIVVGRAGVVWDYLVEKSIQKGLSGIECLSGIPGTLGAAPIQNIGAYGQELADTFESLIAFDRKNEEFIKMNKKDCRFAYRDSIFKKEMGRFIIFEVTLKLRKDNTPKIKYDSLSFYLNENGINNPSLWDVRNAVLAIRKAKLEDWNIIGNAGSFFKNPEISKNEFQKLKKIIGEVSAYPAGNKFKISAAFLIEKAGWKGKSFKTAAVSDKHALILINPDGKAKANDIKNLAEKIVLDVKQKYKVTLVPEVQLIGF